jgi:IMP dehydrogenase/GMP reductase
MHFDKTSNIKVDFNDILIQPADKTSITSRKQINPFDKEGFLPIFTAPMDTVVDEENHKMFFQNKIKICFPRLRNDYRHSYYHSFFYSLSLDEFIKEYNEKTIFWAPGISAKHDGPHKNTRYILIDIANGHMEKMMTAIKTAKQKHGDNIFIMAGNVANPKTYGLLSDAGADAVRIGIGNGNGCLTTQQTGIGYPMASLIRECYYKSLTMDSAALIIADGGMKDYSDIIKAIALGANYVMVGSLLNKCLESCGETRIFKYIKLNPKSKLTEWLYKKGFKLTKRFRGMSTKEVQKNWGNEVIKTSEGVVRVRPVEYTLSQWSGNFEDYLRSAMSYTNCTTLEEFRGNVSLNVISEQAYKRFSK